GTWSKHCARPGSRSSSPPTTWRRPNGWPTTWSSSTTAPRWPPVHPPNSPVGNVRSVSSPTRPWRPALLPRPCPRAPRYPPPRPAAVILTHSTHPAHRARNSLPRSPPGVPRPTSCPRIFGYTDVPSKTSSSNSPVENCATVSGAPSGREGCSGPHDRGSATPPTQAITHSTQKEERVSSRPEGPGHSPREPND